MFLRSNKYKGYYLAKGKNGLTMFREGSDSPIKPLSSYKNSIKYALYINGQKSIVSLVDFLKTCPEFKETSRSGLAH
jgi:hypothetical protein